MNNNIKAGTITGTVLVLLSEIDTGHLLSTVLLAATGATTSYLVAALLRFISKRFYRK